MDGSIATTSTPAIHDDDVVIDHSTPVSLPIGIETPGPVINAPPSNYGVYSSLFEKRFIVGADGQCHAEKYSFRPITRNTLYERKEIGSYALDELKKSLIVNSVSSSNVLHMRLHMSRLLIIMMKPEQ